MEELNRFRKFLNEDTWGNSSADQMVKALQILDKISDMGGVKGSLALDKYGSMLYRVFGDDEFHDAIDNAKDAAIDDDRFRNYIGDAMARGREMTKIHNRVDEGVRELEVGDRVYFNPGKIAVGRDGVTEPDEYYTITGKRRMFASNLHAYTVEDEDGKTVGEYDETQLVKA